MSDLVTILTRIVLVRFILGQYDIVAFWGNNMICSPLEATIWYVILLRTTNLVSYGGKMKSSLDSDCHWKSQSFLEEKKKNNSRSLQFIGTVMVISNPSALKAWGFQSWTILEVWVDVFGEEHGLQWSCQNNSDPDDIYSDSVGSTPKLGQRYPIECTLHLCFAKFGSPWILCL